MQRQFQNVVFGTMPAGCELRLHLADVAASPVFKRETSLSPERCFEISLSHGVFVSPLYSYPQKPPGEYLLPSL